MDAGARRGRVVVLPGVLAVGRLAVGHRGFWAVLICVLALGCGKKEEPVAPPATKTAVTPSDQGPPTAGPEAPSDPFAPRVDASPQAMPVNRRFEDAKMTASGSEALSEIIDKLEVTSVEMAELSGAPASALKAARGAQGIVLGPRVVSVVPPPPYDKSQMLPGELWLSLPLTPEQCRGATSRNVGAVYLSPRGPVYIDGHYDREHSAVVVKVGHLSPFISFRRDPMAEITKAIADEASKRAWAKIESARQKLEEKLIESVEAYLKKQAFEKLDGGVKRSILVALVKNRDDIGAVFAASGAQDPAAFFQSYQLLVGKLIVDHAPKSALRGVLESVTKSTQTIEAVSRAAGQAAGGDYWAAVEILGKAYSQTTFVYKFTVTAAALMDAGWSMLKDDALEVFYEEYKAGTFVPERISRRMDLVMYLQRKFPKPDGSKMTDDEVVKMVLDNFERRKIHEKESAQYEADLKRIYAWYDSRIFLKDQIRKRFNETTDADCFRRFLRILDSIDSQLVRLGIRRRPWGHGGAFQPQVETLELIQAFERGGAMRYKQKLAEIERRLANPLDLRGFTGFWVLDRTKRDTPPPRRGWKKDDGHLVYEVKQVTSHSYEGTVKLKDRVIQTVGQAKTKSIPYTYEAHAEMGWDDLPQYLPNGADWDLVVKASVTETCSAAWDEVGVGIAYELSSGLKPELQGDSPRFVPCYVGVKGSSSNTVRAIQDDEKADRKPVYVSAAPGKPWNDPVTVKFPLIPPSTVKTAERFVLTLEAHTPAGMFRERHTYKWVKELPKGMEYQLHREISRAAYRGARSYTKDMSGATQARPTDTPDKPKPPKGSKVTLTGLSFSPDPLTATRQAIFEVKMENGPRVPSFTWFFSGGSSGQADAWTEVPQARHTYMKPGTYTITVKVRDKNRYARGFLATGSWKVTVGPAPGK